MQYHIDQIRKPLIPSTTTIFIDILIRSRLVTTRTCALARLVSKQGMKIDVPRLNAFQFTS